ncbi:chemotaxis protein CheW [Paracoccus sp. S-4012]|uniref:chemotaxis protein CheW n=1 Tax=Paracoccus sp. S-4012 TaxID=2665648 RepID=UPI0012B096DF|nr:chemotaxis protein CheW [Paracoccus sp. S-4012]MRX50699.1 chemotaxis protein CheW [Paracoccus sp. S-4012]
MSHDSLADVELLSFRLGEQEFCVEVASVREIRGWTPATPLPFAPSHVKGVINLRGTILPVLDLSLRLGMEGIADGERKVIVVVQLNGVSAGLMVDAVSDILTIPAAQLQPLPELGDDIPGCIRALTLLEGQLVRVLNLSAIMPPGGSRAA